MTTNDICLICKKGNKDTYKHLAHAHLTCVMKEMEEARQEGAKDEREKIRVHGTNHSWKTNIDDCEICKVLPEMKGRTLNPALLKEAYEKGAKDEAKRMFEKLAKFRCRKGRCGLCVDCVIGFEELKKECGVE